METLLIVSSLIPLVLSIGACIIFNNNTIYCKIFEPEQYNLFRYMIDHVNEIEYCYRGYHQLEIFFLPNTKYEIIVWKDEYKYKMASIHDIATRECYACTAVKKLSSQLGELLLQKIK